MSVPIFFGIYFYNYTVVTKAANSSARYFSSITRREMRSPVLVKAAKAIAENIAAEMSADLIGEDLIIDIDCDNDPCVGGNTTPKVVKVVVAIRYEDLFFGVVSTGMWGLTVKGKAELNYTGT